MTKDYTISILDDYSRLDEVYGLIRNSYLSTGEIEYQTADAMSSRLYHLDSHKETIIVIAEKDGVIIGTITATVDSKIGLNVDKWFNQEADELRRSESCMLGSAWRLATIPAFRGTRGLIVDLITTGIDFLIESGCTVCLFALMSKHVAFYQRLMKAKVITSIMIPFNKDLPIEISLMEINLEYEWEVNKFKQLKIV